mmetsp:Transcript_86551/g.171833  ORF Transcript_86551/g.171833 Transcript_86551/m.171833 type:complete len:202 (+) Transcript_86551:301-906(+)
MALAASTQQASTRPLLAIGTLAASHLMLGAETKAVETRTATKRGGSVGGPPQVQALNSRTGGTRSGSADGRAMSGHPWVQVPWRAGLCGHGLGNLQWVALLLPAVGHHHLHSLERDPRTATRSVSGRSQTWVAAVAVAVMAAAVLKAVIGVIGVIETIANLTDTGRSPQTMFPFFWSLPSRSLCPCPKPCLGKSLANRHRQ